MAFSETQPSATYQDLIKEVYIDPIRTAVLIDDDFPTLEEYLAGNVPTTQKNNILTDLLNTCRAEPFHWLVDVHNGKKISSIDEVAKYKHLHHSDLMILDYHLDGDTSNDKAMSILRSLASNNYFNMVIVYTNARPSELKDRVLEITKGLTYYNNENLHLNVPESIIEWEDDEADITRILKENFTEDAFLWLMQQRDEIELNWKDNSAFSPIYDLYANRQQATKGKIDEGEFLRWLLNEKIRSSKDSFSKDDLGKVEFLISKTNDMLNWIRTDKLFVTVIQKSTSATNIPKLLLDALRESAPSPHRLLMSKMRNALDGNGVSAEANIIKKGNIQAGLLWSMLNAKPHELQWKLQETISRHWEQLAAAIDTEIHQYGIKLFETVQNDQQDDKHTKIKKYTSIDLTNDRQKSNAIKELNSFICSKKANGIHLMPGQIFTTKDKNGEDVNYWIILSPACDLVPSQNKTKWNEKQIMPLIAVKLWRDSSNLSPSKINSNDYLFLDLNGKTLCFSYRKEPTSAPIWEQFYAIENGAISNKKVKLLNIHEYDIKNNKMESCFHEAEIVSQLRYEYALNLIQKLGSNLTRVGLDFVTFQQ